MTTKRKTEKAAFLFAFLKSISQHSKMKDVDAMAALHFINLVRDDRIFYMSAAHLAKRLGKKSSTTGEESLKRFRTNGFLIHIPEVDMEGDGRERPNGGKLSNIYKMEIPSAVSPKKMGDTIDEVSPKKLGKVSPKKMGTITREQTLEGAGPHKAGQAQTAASVFTVVDKEDDFITDAHGERGSAALEAPPAASASDHEDPETRPFAPPEFRDEDYGEMDNAAGGYTGKPVSLDDLDALLNEEAVAVRWIDPEDAIQAMSDVWGGLLADPDEYAALAVEGFISGREADQAAAVGLTVDALRAANTPDAAALLWAEHLDAMTSLFCAAGRGPEAASRARAAFCAAMAADKARRRASGSGKMIAMEAHANG